MSRRGSGQGSRREAQAQNRRGVRITGGELRGRRLAVPRTARPTEGRVREALFSIWMEALPGSRVLDLFAGSGAVALEAASRGAFAVTAVEGDPEALDLLVENVAALGVRGIVEAFRGALPEFLARLAEDGAGPFDLVFADPPYAYDAYAELLEALEPLLAPGGEIAIEHSSRAELPEEVEKLVKAGTRRYGESGLSFYRREESEGSAPAGLS